ncbi:MAG: HU family DNA-binding protein [Leptospirales bacterium]|jgi:DNA-binding protein HU-beta|uniref:Histone family protein DNA-binding protein n=1 Tax=mine drainage metagenome TaxID=410659 RepID=T1DGI0_9ZZZZ
MNKTELIEKVAKSSKLSKKDVHSVVDGFLKSIEASMKKGEKVTIVGFGTFGTVQRKARTGRNPKTGKEIKIAAKTAPKFSPGKALRESVNSKAAPKKK